MAAWVRAGSGTRTSIWKQLLAPALADGVLVGDLWMDLTTGLLKQATSISPVTWTAITASSQISDPELAALAGLTSAADKVPYFTGSGTADVADFPSAGRTLVATTAWPKFRAYRTTSDQVIGTGAFTKVQLNAETFDTASAFDSATNFRFQPTIAGYYFLSGEVAYTMGVGDINILVQVSLYKNGSASATAHIYNAVANNFCLVNVQDLIFLNGSTDYIELFTKQDSGGDRSIAAASSVTFLSGSLQP